MNASVRLLMASLALGVPLRSSAQVQTALRVAICQRVRSHSPVDPVTLLKKGVRTERDGIFTGVKVIRAGPQRAQPDTAPHSAGPPGDHRRGEGFERTVRIWRGGPGKTRLEFVRPEGGSQRTVIENGSKHF